MSYESDVILDANGDPMGRYRDNQDPSEPQRLHPVPKVNAKGKPITERVRVGGTDEAPEFAEVPVTQDLPIDDPRVAAVLDEQGLVADGGVIVAKED